MKRSGSIKVYFSKIMKIIFILILASVIHISIFGQSAKPNFIIILTDDQGWTCTSTLMNDLIPNSKSDYYETPNIERLAQSGMRFTSGYAPAALCCPTRRSIQFGQTPVRQGEVHFKENYHPENKKWLTIPIMLKSIDPSYQTAHYGKWDLRGDIFPEELGYDESDGNTGNKNGNVNSNKQNKWTAFFLNNDPKRIETISARAINFMQRQVDSCHPFYLQVSHYATHVDMQTKEETYQKYLKKGKGDIHSNPAWAGMLEDLDSGIGKIMDAVEKLGIADNTYIIYLADNGAAEFIPPVKNKLEHPSKFEKHMRNYPLRGGKWVLYEGGIRVPFIVKGPGIKPGSQCDIPVVGWDILPTISDLAGNEKALPDYLDGASFRTLLENSKGEVARKEEGIIFHRYNNNYPHSSIRLGNYKLIKFWKTKKLELYDLSKDLGEINDIANEMPEKVQNLHQRMMNYFKEVDAEILSDFN